MNKVPAGMAVVVKVAASAITAGLAGVAEAGLAGLAASARSAAVVKVARPARLEGLETVVVVTATEGLAVLTQWSRPAGPARVAAFARLPVAGPVDRQDCARPAALAGRKRLAQAAKMAICHTECGQEW